MLSDDFGQLDGSVHDQANKIVKEYAVVVFPEDRERWGFLSRFVRTARPDQDGHFKIPGVPPGDYLAAAVDSAEPGEFSDPDVLDALRDRAKRIHVQAGEHQTLALELASRS